MTRQVWLWLALVICFLSLFILELINYSHDHQPIRLVGLIVMGLGLLSATAGTVGIVLWASRRGRRTSAQDRGRRV